MPWFLMWLLKDTGPTLGDLAEMRGRDWLAALLIGVSPFVVAWLLVFIFHVGQSSL
jgi:hypothetical protein